MKKNAMMKIAAILMVAVLLTTCAISSTFAKYTTTGEAGTASARVAKWGVTINTTITDLFVDKYDAGSEDEVIGFEAADVVAPGTIGSATLDTSVKGTPEVAVEVTTAAEIDFGDGWLGADEKYYCPVYFTVNDETKCGNDFTSITEFENWIKGEIVKATKQYKAGTDLSAATDFDLELSWEWKIEGGTKQTNENDTALGNAGLADDGSFNLTNQPTIFISITQTVTQLNDYTAG